MAPAIVSDFANDADDHGPGGRGVFVAGLHAMTKSAAAGPKAFGERFADDGDGSGIRGIAIVELASFHQRDAEEPEIGRSGAVVGGEAIFAELSGLAFEAEGVCIHAGERNLAGGCGGGDAGTAVELINQIVIESGALLGGGVARKGQGDAEGENRLRIGFDIEAQECLHSLDHEACADEENER